jgi:PAS domain S-box-containing protein
MLWYMLIPAGTFLPHGVCYSWNSPLIALHAGSDIVIGLAYFSIPPALWYFVRKRMDLPFSWMFLLFGLFIVACGSTHWMEVWTLWHPSYWAAGLIKAFTAAASLPTAVALFFLIPRALSIPSMTEVRRARDELQAEVAKRRSIEEDLLRAQRELERRVEERTSQLSLSEAHFRQLAETIPHMIWVAGEQGQLQYVNGRYRTYFGWTTDEPLRTETILAHAHPDDLPAARTAWQSAISSGGDFTCEMRLRRAADAVYRWHLIRSAAVRDHNGQISQWYGSATDLDEQRRLQERLAEEDRRKDEFLAVLAHELRNPLAPLGNALQLLARSNDRSELVAEVREVMQRQLRHLVRLVDDLLDVSRIRQGKIELRSAEIDINRVVQQAVETSLHMFRGKGQSISMRPAAAPAMVMGDETRLNQVFQNLLSNAAKFTPSNGRIRVAVNTQEDEVRVVVSDDGQGITKEDLPFVFDLFAQARTANAGGGDGLGIGLNIARQLVEKHGGNIEATSEGLGRGSQFTITLPRIREVRLTGSLLRPKDVAGSEPVSAIKGWKVLIVDDSVDSADTLAMLLAVRGYRVHTAYSGPEALSVAATFSPDVVLLDLGMPEMDGHEVARRLREEVGLWTSLIVAQTGWGQQRDRDASEAAGFDHHLVKPIDLEDLERLILSGRRSL